MTSTIVPDVERVVERVRSARATGIGLRVVGAGLWLDAGRPCSAMDRLDVGALQGIVSYEPGDLTLSARAGTSLSDIARATAAEGQWLTLDPHGSPDGTLGATVATASYGPLASAFGAPRDHVLGCEFVSGTGDVVRAGGRVVKNVAGFDLTRLVTGAWGTLGVLTEITVRLRARPAIDRTVAVPVTGSQADAAWRWLRASHYTPLAAELVSHTLARHLSLDGPCLLLRLGGNDAFVRAAADAVSRLGTATDVSTSTWNALSLVEPPQSIVVRLSTLPARIGTLWQRAVTVAEALGGYAHATLARGVMRIVVPAPADDEATAQLHAALVAVNSGCTVAGERLPASLWAALTRARSTDSLASGVHRAFDPDRILNTGIQGGA